jgi:hypothetical protein
MHANIHKTRVVAASCYLLDARVRNTTQAKVEAKKLRDCGERLQWQKPLEAEHVEICRWWDGSPETHCEWVRHRLESLCYGGLKADFTHRQDCLCHVGIEFRLELEDYADGNFRADLVNAEEVGADGVDGQTIGYVAVVRVEIGADP